MDFVTSIMEVQSQVIPKKIDRVYTCCSVSDRFHPKLNLTIKVLEITEKSFRVYFSGNEHVNCIYRPKYYSSSSNIDH